ncbi:phosphoserine aminotransferase [Boletus edulis BED1]|uniref:phosphoserine transaminase n=1 Tax=Boletus edulis BED1 TaxID=1328754 RepID=A0AAD4C3A6_BOLED|nr:phosphoserine aminotransferase [Boletus edulis BED1]
MSDRVINFGAGPSALPEEVLTEACKGLLNFQNTGIGIAEISHRSADFNRYIREVEENMRTLLQLPQDYKVLFAQGGGTAQFSAVVLNMLARYRSRGGTAEKPAMDYIVTGSWSEKAMKEAKRLGLGDVNVIVNTQTIADDGKKTFNHIPDHDSYKNKFSQDPALIYYCVNETVDGVEFNDDLESPTSFPFDSLPDGAPLVADYSSSFMSRPIPYIDKHAVIYAGAQKNIGPAGLTIIIVRDEWANVSDNSIPLCLSYKALVDSRSLYNTPPVLSIYITGLVLRRMLEIGAQNGRPREKALEYYGERTVQKASKVNAALKEGEARGIFKGKVLEGSGSKMNVVFDVVGGEDKLKEFVSGAEQRGMKGLKGHRSVGGVRVSLYNAVTEDQVDKLIQYMNQFM